MSILYETQERMEDELKELNHKEQLTTTDLDIIYKIVDIIKDITTINAMNKADYEHKEPEWEEKSYMHDKTSKEDMLSHISK